MMGQQQQTVAGSALRRIILALAIAAVMATMEVSMAASAFAAGGTPGFPAGGYAQNNVNGSGNGNSPVNDTGGDDKNVSDRWDKAKAKGDGNN
jgi:hypothetical protein